MFDVPKAYNNYGRHIIVIETNKQVIWVLYSTRTNHKDLCWFLLFIYFSLK